MNDNAIYWLPTVCLLWDFSKFLTLFEPSFLLCKMKWLLVAKDPSSYQILFLNITLCKLSMPPKQLWRPPQTPNVNIVLQIAFSWSKTKLFPGPDYVILRAGGSSPLRVVSADPLFLTFSEPFLCFLSPRRFSCIFVFFLIAPASHCVRKVFYGTHVKDIMGNKLSSLEE